ncbi:unnamed protein product [Schistosoma mattheei]|nr:unnamed protein product [Schistosoma mattheei]
MKPGSTLDNPIYYGPIDFSINSKIDIFGTRFIITDADEYVLKFLEANRDQFSDELINGLHEHLNNKENQTIIKQQFYHKGGNVDFKRE